nr:MAG TPA_asm: hypothetical protein [Caudoviricetes sp.]
MRLFLFLIGSLISPLYYPYLTRYLTRNGHRVR